MITVKVKENTISARVKNQTITINADGKYIPKDIPVYTGEYVVIPKAFNETILPTNGKMMNSDVTVRKVPYYETSNTSGKTVYIASEV